MSKGGADKEKVKPAERRVPFALAVAGFDNPDARRRSAAIVLTSR